MIAGLFLFLGCTAEPDPAPAAAKVGEATELTLVYTGDVHGEIEPCG